MYVYIHTHTYIIYTAIRYTHFQTSRSQQILFQRCFQIRFTRDEFRCQSRAAELASTAAGGGIGGANCVNFCYLQENHQPHGRIIELTYFWWATKVPSDGAVVCCSNLCLVWGTDLILVGGAPVNTAVESNSSSKAPPGIRRKNGPRRVMDDSFSDLNHTCTLS